MSTELPKGELVTKSAYAINFVLEKLPLNLHAKSLTNPKQFSTEMTYILGESGFFKNTVVCDVIFIFEAKDWTAVCKQVVITPRKILLEHERYAQSKTGIEEMLKKNAPWIEDIHFDETAHSKK